jgi:hypothetical protein
MGKKEETCLETVSLGLRGGGSAWGIISLSGSLQNG